jgi:hypothetical protein
VFPCVSPAHLPCCSPSANYHNCDSTSEYAAPSPAGPVPLTDAQLSSMSLSQVISAYKGVLGQCSCPDQCTKQTQCSATQYEAAAPTASTDRVCKPLTTCGSSKYESQAATATSDRTCLPVKTCSAGQYQAALPTATTDRVCLTLTACVSDQYELQAPTATTDRVCSKVHS